VNGTPPVSAIFLHSAFRAGSTWFWNRFREAAGTYAYYEPFHEHKALMTRDTIAFDRQDIWNSGHPPLSAPYNAEYLPLLKLGGGVVNYQNRFDFQAYYSSGAEPEQQLYIEALAQYAHILGKIPVFGFCRSQGRVPWFKRTCRGVNIVTLRNPWDQWSSIMEQIERKNGYFAFRVFRAACVGSHASEYHSLFDGLSLPQPIGPTSETQSASIEDYFWKMSFEKLFRVFLLVYVVDTLMSVPAADATVDLDRLSHSAEERASVTRHLRQLTGLDDLSFDDCSLPRHPPHTEAIFPTVLAETLATLALFESRTGTRSPDILRAKLQEAQARFQ
jgi:hypothetical protein